MSEGNKDLKRLTGHFVYLDNLRKSGCTNMYGARPYLVKARRISAEDAGDVLVAWMRTFDDRPATLRARVAIDQGLIGTKTPLTRTY